MNSDVLSNVNACPSFGGYRCNLMSRYLPFIFLYWSAASLLLFAERFHVAQTHVDVSLIRHFYVFVIGVLFSLSATGFLKSEFFRRVKRRLSVVTVFCVAAAAATALLLNPITYLMVGYRLNDIPLRILSTGTLYFFLFDFLWCALYMQFTGQSLLAPVAISEAEAGPDGEEIQPRQPSFAVEKLGEKRILHANYICYIRAKGDYVELLTDDNCYMIKQTLAGLLKLLDASSFRRVHRSLIVNASKVTGVKACGGGTYELSLEGGHRVRSSRSYKAAVEQILPKA